ncbi:MAG: RidA family protein [Chloroflexi bacterium]|nr:RidA family protein [Chloroflexota bacterium]
MPIERLNPPDVGAPRGYHHVVKAGNTVYVAGQVARASDGSTVGKGDFAAQADRVFTNLKACLRAAGASTDDLVKITVYMTRSQDLEEYRRIRAQHIGSEDTAPASTLVVISQLANPDFLIEVEAVAFTG